MYNTAIPILNTTSYAILKKASNTKANGNTDPITGPLTLL